MDGEMFDDGYAIQLKMTITTVLTCKQAIWTTKRTNAYVKNSGFAYNGAMENASRKSRPHRVTAERTNKTRFVRKM